MHDDSLLLEESNSDVSAAVPKTKHRATLTYAPRTAIDEIADLLCDALEADDAANDADRGAA